MLDVNDEETKALWQRYGALAKKLRKQLR